MLGNILLVAALSWTAGQPLRAASNIILWDTGSSFTDATAAKQRAAWKPVPTELFAFEADPAKAASDPGYYGREYAFQGDAVVENRRLTAVFRSANGRVVLYAKNQPNSPGDTSGANAGLGAKVFEFLPRPTAAPPGKIRRCEIVRNAADEVVLKATFAAGESAGVSAVFAFGRDEIVAIKPAPGMPRFRLVSPIAYGVAPAFIGDDLVFDPAAFDGTDPLSVSAENIFLGLLQGEGRELVMTWPEGKQRLQLRLSHGVAGKAGVESIDFDNDGQPVYLAALSAPGIWHREVLPPQYLEKDVALNWKPPFAAKWKTQLTEGSVRTTYAFRNAKGTIWRAVAGSYTYPVWFDGDKAFCHLSKKVPPKGESIIYFLEPQNTPPAVLTPADVLKATLGRPQADALLDVAGRKLRTHHRRGGEGVHRACTCGCTEAIQAVFAAKQETAKRDYVKEALDDMNYFVQRHVERIEEYRQFAADVIRLLQSAAAANADLKPFSEELLPIVQQIPEEYDVQRDNMKSLAHAAELTRQTMALTARPAADNLKAYNQLLDAWRAMGGAQDSVVGQCHGIARQLFQAAGYGCATNAPALAVAQAVQARCRAVLRNPDGYEIWAEY